MENFMAEYGYIALFIIMVAEFILGSTKFVKANSTVESVINVTVSILKFLFVKKDEDKK